MDRDEARRFALGWDALAERYAEELSDELERKPYDRALLERFAAGVTPGAQVLDVGCGPGHVTAHLETLGLRARGVDLCPSMIEVARARYPELHFAVGDMLALDLEPGSLGGAIAFYSLIHLTREDVTGVLRRLAAGMTEGAPLALAVHAGQGEAREDEVLGEPVPMAITLFERDEMQGYVEDAGFHIDVCETRPPYEGEYPSKRVYVLATR